MTAPTASPGAPWSAAPPRRLVFAPRGRRELAACVEDGVPCLLVELPPRWRVLLLPMLLLMPVTLAFVFTLIWLAIRGQTGTAYYVCLGAALVASFAALQLAQFLGGRVPILIRTAEETPRPVLSVVRRFGWNPVAFRRTVHDAEGRLLGAIILRRSSWRVQGAEGLFTLTARDLELLTVHLHPRPPSRSRLQPVSLTASHGAVVATVHWARNDRSFLLDAERAPADAFAMVLAWAVLADQALRR
jgi:hypothetical protein